VTLPNVALALSGLTQQLQFSIVGKLTVDFQVVEISKDIIRFPANIQPIPARKLIIKPEGQRKWKWWTMTSRQKLDTDYVVQGPDGLKFRVMSVFDWSAYGYYKYELAQGREALENNG
jgi:hypothetical protein